MLNVFVSGTNGFIGRAICKKIVSHGWQVTGSVRADPPKGSLNAGVRVLNLGPIEPDTEWDAALDGIDTVVHLAACLRTEAEACADPIRAYRGVNVVGTEGLARAAANAQSGDAHRRGGDA